MDMELGNNYKKHLHPAVRSMPPHAGTRGVLARRAFLG